MNEKKTIQANLGLIFRIVAIIFTIFTAAVISVPTAAEDLVSKKQLKIGVIGSGRIGGTLVELWVKAGHEVLFSSRHPEELQELADRLGPTARAGMPREAAEFGEVILISIPYHAVPQVGRDLQRELAGKVVLETGNPYPSRDGEMAVTARARGTGLSSAEFLPGVRLVRAFNSVGHFSLRSEAHRPGERVGIPLAGDDSRGRNSCYQEPPAQTRTCGFPASGSSVVLAFA